MCCSSSPLPASFPSPSASASSSTTRCKRAISRASAWKSTPRLRSANNPARCRLLNAGHGRFPHTRSRDREHADVILLTELFCRLRDSMRGLLADGQSARKAEELPLLIRGLHNTIGDKRQPVAGIDLIARLHITSLRL